MSESCRSAPSDRRAELIDAADLCVKCGLCLPHCPTYLDSRHEADSPRGRIALMQGLASGQTPVTERMQIHLDGCLGCRACERVCPAKVPYGRLIDAARAELAVADPRRFRATQRLANLLSSPAALRVFGALLWLYQRSGLQRLLRASGLLGRTRLARLESLLPDLKPGVRARNAGPASSDSTESVQLFTGCVGRLVDTETLDSVQMLLERMGRRVTRPAGQTCCGALHQHNGAPDEARGNLRRNLGAFAGDDTIVHCASGCGATLIEYPDLDNSEATRAFRDRLEDVITALQDRWPDTLQLRPLSARVALHLPCSQRNVLGHGDAIATLLRRIPQIELVDLDSAQTCCGAAGSYVLSQPETADRLLEPKLERASELAVDYIVSTNVGCALHLAGGLRRRGGPMPEVLHPATLLARQLQMSDCMNRSLPRDPS